MATAELGDTDVSEVKEAMRRIFDDRSTTELNHSDYATLCARTTLIGDYSIDDPNSELCLETARVCGQSALATQASIQGKQVVCCDTFFLDTVPGTPEARLAQLKQTLDELREELNASTAAYERPSVTEENINFFEERGLSRPDAEGCVWALSFYTGEGSKSSSRAGSLCIRQGNLMGQSSDPDVEAFLSKTKTILYFLVTALKHIRYYWGPVVRFLTLKHEDEDLYKKGNIVTWLQFSSSCKGAEGPKAFSSRNAKFVIWSVKGRDIDRFSNYSTKFGYDENEVLFLPFTRLLILKVLEKGTYREIHCREMELGITRGMPLLWVDDNILKPDFEMKRHMEEAQIAKAQEIKFILKPSTKLAVAYLRSPFGRMHLIRDTRLRVMSDMTRPDEEEGDRAGANFVKILSESKFSGQVMIFSSSVEAALAKLNAVGARYPAQALSHRNETAPHGHVGVTTSDDCAVRFCCFD